MGHEVPSGDAGNVLFFNLGDGNKHVDFVIIFQDVYLCLYVFICRYATCQ